MFCSKCGTQLEDTDLFCTVCGSKVKPIQEREAQKQAVNDDEVYTRDVEPKEEIIEVAAQPEEIIEPKKEAPIENTKGAKLERFTQIIGVIAAIIITLISVTILFYGFDNTPATDRGLIQTLVKAIDNIKSYEGKYGLVMIDFPILASTIAAVGVISIINIVTAFKEFIGKKTNLFKRIIVMTSFITVSSLVLNASDKGLTNLPLSSMANAIYILTIILILFKIIMIAVARVIKTGKKIHIYNAIAVIVISSICLQIGTRVLYEGVLWLSSDSNLIERIQDGAYSLFSYRQLAISFSEHSSFSTAMLVFSLIISALLLSGIRISYSNFENNKKLSLAYIIVSMIIGFITMILGNIYHAVVIEDIFSGTGVTISLAPGILGIYVFFLAVICIVLTAIYKAKNK